MGVEFFTCFKCLSRIDDVRLYNRALGVEEIRELGVREP